MIAQVKNRKKLTATEARNLRTLLLLSVFQAQDIGGRIRQARHETGLTQEELADLVGVSTRSLQGYEGGDVVPYRHMGRIAEITTRSVAWLLHGETETVSPSVTERLDRIEEQLDEIRGLLSGLGARGKPRSASSR